MAWEPSFYISKMSLDLNNVFTKFQFALPANDSITEGSLFSHFSGSLFSHFSGSLFSHFSGSLHSDFSKCWKIQQRILWQKSFYISKMSLDPNNVSTMFQLDRPANNRIVAGSFLSHFSGSLFSDISKCWEVQQWMPWLPTFYISKMSLDMTNVSTKFQFDWPANNRIIEQSLFS